MPQRSLGEGGVFEAFARQRDAPAASPARTRPLRRLTTELVRKAKRDDAIVIHVSPEMW